MDDKVNYAKQQKKHSIQEARHQPPRTKYQILCKNTSRVKKNPTSQTYDAPTEVLNI